MKKVPGKVAPKTKAPAKHAESSATKPGVAAAIHHTDLESAKRHFEEFLKNNAFKLTGQRHDILDRIAEINRHFTADDLVDEVRRRREGPSKATVYRTLSLMTMAGVLEEHKFANSAASMYEIAWGRHHHDHLICLDCSTIYEFYDQMLEDVQDRAAGAQGFKPLTHSLKIYGVCATCLKKSRPPNAPASA